MEEVQDGTERDGGTLSVYLRPHEAGAGWELCLNSPDEPLLAAYSYAEALDLVSAVAGRQHASGRACLVYVRSRSTEGWETLALGALGSSVSA